MAWVILFLAGLLEIGWAVGLKVHGRVYSVLADDRNGHFVGREHGTAGPVAALLPLGTAYAVWTGIGTLGTVVLGIALFREPATVLRLPCIGLIRSGSQV